MTALDVQPRAISPAEREPRRRHSTRLVNVIGEVVKMRHKMANVPRAGERTAESPRGPALVRQMFSRELARTELNQMFSTSPMWEVLFLLSFFV